MADKRKIEIPVLPYIVLIFGLLMIVASALLYVNFPDQAKLAVGFLSSGVMVGAISFFMRPAMVNEILKNRKTILWVNDIALILIIIAIGAILSYIGFRRNFRYDFTRNKMFTLSDQTIKILRNLEKDVKVTAFYPKGTTEEQMVKELLHEYKRHSQKFQLNFVDPFRDPMTVKAMNVRSAGTIVVQCESNRKDIIGTDIFEVPSPYAGKDARPKFKGEQVVTSAILNVTSGQKRKISFVKGHREASISGYNTRDLIRLHELLISENYDVDEVNLIEGNIATNTSLLVIVSPQTDFLQSELEKIRNFVKRRHGHLLIAMDPLSQTSEFEQFLLKDYGVLVNHDVVVDPRGIQREYWTVAPELTNHKALTPIKSANLICIMFHCCSLTVEGRDGYNAVTYLETIENSWAKRNLKVGDEINLAFEEGKDARGPLNLAVAIEDNRTATASKILVFGDADFMGNAYLPFGGNKDLIINSINWMLGQEQMISIRPKVLEMSEVILDENAANRIFTFCVIVSPMLIVILGGFVFMLRRRV